MRYLGIDYGEKHIGLAIGDSETRLSMPYKTIDRRDDISLIESLRFIVSEEGIDIVVMGVPRGPATLQEQQKKNLAFADFLAREIPSCSVVTADESFTSLEAGKRMKETGKRLLDDHAIAAMLILQGYLDRGV